MAPPQPLTSNLSNRLLAQLCQANCGTNICFSPLSLAVALCMTARGTGGATREAVLGALGLGGSSQADIDTMIGEARKAFAMEGDGGNRGQRFLRRLKASSRQGTSPPVLSVANSLWVHDPTALATDFREACETHYAAVLGSLAAGPSVINRWVAKETRNRIRDMIEEIGPNDVLVLLNAVYFKGSWRHPFSLAATTAKEFARADGVRIRRPFMRQTETFGYFEEAGLQAVSLRYASSSFAMDVVLPAREQSVGDVVARIAEDGFYWVVNAQRREVALDLPRFRMQWGAELKEAFAALGMARAFDPADAEFQPMFATRLTPATNVYISSVTHKTAIEVDEEGTEAAAATAVDALELGMPEEPPPPIPMIVDRPFVFVIRSVYTQNALFAGVVHDP